MPKPLSPTAQAVLDAYNQDPFANTGESLAAVLHAVAEEVVLPKHQYADWKMADLIMREIQAVADELEAQ